VSDPSDAPRRRAAEDRRAELLDVARRLFAEHGYRATTTRQIASAAGVSDALLYRHFASKQDMLEQIVDQAVSAFSESPPLERLRELPLPELLRLLGRGFVERAEANLELITLLIAERETLEDTRFARFIDRAATGLGGELQRRVPGLDSDDGYLSARTFFGALVSFVLLQRVLGMDREHPVAVEAYLDHRVGRTAAGLSA
jgi:AcrR family transcriptional regulator